MQEERPDPDSVFMLSGSSERLGRRRRIEKMCDSSKIKKQDLPPTCFAHGGLYQEARPAPVL